MKNFQIRTLEAEESFSDQMAAVMEKIFDFIASDVFRGILIFLGVALFLFILVRIYMRLRTSHLGNIEYERTFSRDGIYEGETVEMIETIRNRGFFPLLFVDVESYLYPCFEIEEYGTGKTTTMPVLISRFQLLPYVQIRRRHRLRCTARGYYQLQTASIYDRGGAVPLQSPAELYVYPKVIPMSLSRLAVGRLQGEYTSMRPLYSDPFSLSGIRDYRFGDTVSQINFKASARVPISGSSASPLKVNNRDFCASRRLMVYMDFHLPIGTVMNHEEYTARAERGLSYSSALIRDAVYAGYAVGFAANCKLLDGSLSLRFPKDSSEAHMMEIMRAMAALLPQDGASFNSLLEYDITEGMSDTEIVIFCYVMSEDTLTRVAALEQMGNSVKVVLLTAEDLYEGGDAV
ncbi:MAG: DUF58 domain-containing protein [Clostridia bacterium]|nr:DUF58 domain-containing protein [Clostridia bacterium]MBQ7339214.1 DUF58 domain-containing protein [Clostridia bacterium]